jgi:LysR family transcriptional regulator, glycine cleavage system transcriptional activator
VFVAVAQHLSFTRAAEALGVTASAASLQIRALEEYLGRTLLRRNGRHVYLTEQGAELLPRIQRARNSNLLWTTRAWSGNQALCG